MRVSEALELAEQSGNSFEARLKDLGIKELYELTDGLRFANYPEAFKTSHKFLINKLAHALEELENLEKNSTPLGITALRRFVCEEIGFSITPGISPSIGLKEYMDEILTW